MSKYSKLQGHLTNYNIPTNIIALIKGNLVTNLYKAVNDICGFVFRQFKDPDTNLLTTTLVKQLQAEGVEVSSKIVKEKIGAKLTKLRIGETPAPEWVDILPDVENNKAIEKELNSYSPNDKKGL